MTQSQNGSGSSHYARQIKYRVMLLRANGEIGLVCLCSDRNQAVQIARDVCEKHLQRLKQHWKQIVYRPDRPRIVFLEVWDGTQTSGHWRLPWRTPFRFEFHDRARGHQPFEEQLQVVWKTGSLAPCVLLSRKTRKGGWRAKIENATFEGPITNWRSIPASCTAGDKVVLKVCGISAHSHRAQFAVPDEGVSTN